MAEDFTLIFLLELVGGLAVFSLLSAYAYRRIRRYRRDLEQLRARLDSIQGSLNASREALHAVRADSESRLSVSEMDHSFSLFSMHVLHHLPRHGARRSSARRQPIKQSLRRKL